MLQQPQRRAELLRLASFLEYHGSQPSRASVVVGKALGGNDVKSRLRELRPGDWRGGRRPHARPHAGPRWLHACVTSLGVCAITLRNSLLVSLELNAKQKTRVESATFH